MTTVRIFQQKLPMHPRLGRHIHFDSRSKAYALQPQTAPVTSVRHAQSIPVLDQGQVGSCTGNAAVSAAYHAPFFAPGATPWKYEPEETGALAWYHDNTVNDDYPGTYTPDDTGSDGLTASKVAQAAGIITGYQAALDLDSSLQALMDRPGITGIPWYNSMFNPGAWGLMDVSVPSGLAGGHELCVDEIVAADDKDNGTGELLVGGPNSWGTSWGAQGRWYLRASDWWELRKRQGDVYFWTAKSQPAPTPTPDRPVDTYDVDLWAALEDWTTEPHVGANHKAAAAAKTWAHLKGLA